MALSVLVVVAVLCLTVLLSASFSAAVPCGGAGYDVSQLTFSDYYYNDTRGGYNWSAPQPSAVHTHSLPRSTTAPSQYEGVSDPPSRPHPRCPMSQCRYFHPCGNVTFSGCQGLDNTTSGGTMLCQLPYTGGLGYSAASWIPENTQSSTSWQPYGGGGGGNNNPRGVTMSLQDGGYCSAISADRSLLVNYQCGNQNQPTGYATITSIVEYSTCQYNLTIITNLVCNGPSINTGQVSCGSGGNGGINLASITTTDLIYKPPIASANYTYYFRPCGVVTSPQCANNPFGGVAGQAMVCQATGQNNEISPNTYDIAWWNPTLAQWDRTVYSGATAWTMTIADGTSCGSNLNRIFTVYWVCSASATTPIFQQLTENGTCNYIAVVLTVLACNQQTISTNTTACGGPYDLAFATQRDLIYQTGTSSGAAYYVFRPCGIVDNAVCQSQPTTNQSMMCQAYQGSTSTYDLAIYNPALTTYTPTLTGIQMYIQDGDQCAAIGAPRSLTVNFNCAQGGPVNSINFVSFTEASTCQYVANVTTPAVCRATRQGGICGVNAGGGQYYDFSLASGSEYSISTSSGYTYYFQPCGQVQNAQCNANPVTANSMLCQAVNGAFTTYDIAYYDYNLVSWYKLTNGWQMFVQDGSSCGGNGYQRALTVNFICASAPSFLNFTELTTCNYVAYITTPQACSPITQAGSTGLSLAGLTGASATGAPAYETITKCGGIYNLLPLSTTDLVWSDPNYSWYFRPCGAVSSNSNCTAAAASTSGGWMLCQNSLNGPGDYEGSTYNQYTAYWTTTRNGVLMTQSDGAGCGTAGARVTRAFFTCNTAATTAYITNITESPTCTYNIIVQTNLVCPVTTTTCGGAGYDLSAVTALAGDIAWVPSTAVSSYAWYFHPCGVVSNSQCQSNVLTQSAMMCQASQTSNTTYNVAVWAPQAATWTALPQGGVQMVIQDGSTCDNYDFERVLTVNFQCGQGGQAYYMNVTEVSLCNYLALVNLPQACSVYQTSSSSSSSLSGGAIAGIVIGSIVGAIILLGLLLVVCCGAGGGLRTKKSNTEYGSEGQQKAGNGRYGGMDEDVSQSNVEMETHDTTAPSSP